MQLVPQVTLIIILSAHSVEDIDELIEVLWLLEDVDFVFLLLARDSSSELGSPLARASVLVIDASHHHMIYLSS